jgi:hypothetical protein
MKKHDIISLLSSPSPEEIFFDYELHALNSFFVIDPNSKEYQTNRKKESYLDDMNFILNSYKSGKTIVIKNLEFFIDLTEEFGKGIDIHAYLVPQNKDNNGDSFNWHTDDRNVWAKIIYGEKIFALRYSANETIMENYIKLKTGQKIHIPKGQWHKAIPTGASCLLSIGAP